MANSILTSIFAPSPLKVINETNSYPYWLGTAVKSVEVMLDASVTDNPLANKSFTEESLYTDLLDVDTSNGKVLRPVKIKITALTDNLAIVESAMGSTVDPALTFTITSKSIIAESMMLIDLTITQAPENLSSVELVFEFEQSEPTIADDFDPDNPSNRSNFGIRIQLPESELDKALANLQGRVKDSVSNLYDRVSSSIGL